MYLVEKVSQDIIKEGDEEKEAENRRIGDFKVSLYEPSRKSTYSQLLTCS